MADGLVEASRGLWRSAIESFSAAAEAAPDDPAPLLALACCHLARDTPELALVVLETGRRSCAQARPGACAATGWWPPRAWPSVMPSARRPPPAACPLPSPTGRWAPCAGRGRLPRGLDLLLAGHRPRATVSASRRMP
ncbi:MAG: hypothetical protein R3F43_01630 [bacterium]